MADPNCFFELISIVPQYSLQRPAEHVAPSLDTFLQPKRFNPFLPITDDKSRNPETLEPFTWSFKL